MRLDQTNKALKLINELRVAVKLHRADRNGDVKRVFVTTRNYLHFSHLHNVLIVNVKY